MSLHPWHTASTSGFQQLATHPGSASAGGVAVEDEPLAPVDEGRLEAVRQAVIALLEDTRTPQERRWEPRVLFVRPVRLTCRVPQAAGKEVEQAYHGVTTDISTVGVGLLAFEELPTRRLALHAEEVSFDCEVVWFEELGHNAFRYGVRFVDVIQQ